MPGLLMDMINYRLGVFKYMQGLIPIPAILHGYMLALATGLHSVFTDSSLIL
jgi:hypothetical protein